MTVKELIKNLHGFCPDHEVVLSSDPEGNSFAGVGTIESNNFRPCGRHDIELVPEPDDDDDDVTPCVVIWP